MLAAGYQHDVDSFPADPLFKPAMGRLPKHGDLRSQSTVSRTENLPVGRRRPGSTRNDALATVRTVRGSSLTVGRPFLPPPPAALLFRRCVATAADQDRADRRLGRHVVGYLGLWFRRRGSIRWRRGLRIRLGLGRVGHRLTCDRFRSGRVDEVRHAGDVRFGGRRDCLGKIRLPCVGHLCRSRLCRLWCSTGRPVGHPIWRPTGNLGDEAAGQGCRRWLELPHDRLGRSHPRRGRIRLRLLQHVEDVERLATERIGGCRPDIDRRQIGLLRPRGSDRDAFAVTALTPPAAAAPTTPAPTAIIIARRLDMLRYALHIDRLRSQRRLIGGGV